MAETAEEIHREAVERYWHDAEFHARVYLTLQVMQSVTGSLEGRRIMDPRSFAREVAAVALRVAEERM